MLRSYTVDAQYHLVEPAAWPGADTEAWAPSKSFLAVWTSGAIQIEKTARNALSTLSDVAFRHQHERALH